MIVNSPEQITLSPSVSALFEVTDVRRKTHRQERTEDVMKRTKRPMPMLSPRCPRSAT